MLRAGIENILSRRQKMLSDKLQAEGFRLRL